MGMEITQSEVGDFKRCRYKWYLNYVLRWTPKNPIKPFEDGGCFHDGLEDYGKGLSMVEIAKNMRTSYQKMMKNIRVPMTKERADDYNLRLIKLQGMVYGYFNKYKVPDANQWEILENEEEFCVEVESKRPKIKFKIRGKKDKRVRKLKDNSVWLIEHKTAGSIPASYINKLPLDQQTLTYCWADWKTYGKDSADGVVYDVVRKPAIRQKKNQTREDYYEELREIYDKKAGEYFFREELRYSKKMLKSFERSLIMIARLMQDAKEKPKSFVYKNEGACNDFGGCPYKDICIKRSLKGPHMNQFYKRDKKHQELEEGQ